MSISLEDQYDKIYKYCYFKVKIKEIAEDLTQETFLKYFAQNAYISRGKPLAYLYTIAKNQCTDYFRKQQPVPLQESCVI
ncbi:MAG: RNA polymerase sigma factor, partial [Cellulosilyticaceae bacterium]